MPDTTGQHLDLDAIDLVLAAYRDHPDLGFACCSAHPVADAATAMAAEIRRLRNELDEVLRLRDNALRALYRDDLETDIDLEETIAAPFYGPGWDWDEADLQHVVREAAAAVRPAFGKLTQQRDEARADAAVRGEAADATNPTPLRWGLDDVLWGDDDSVTVLLSGPSGEPYWLELESERAAVLRGNLAGPDGQEGDAAPADRAQVLLEAAEIAEDVAESLRKHHEFERSTGALDVMTELRRLADEAQQPEARLQRVQCGDCGAVGPVVAAEDGLAYLDPSGQIGHQPQAGTGGVQIFSTGRKANKAQQSPADREAW